MWWTFNLPSDHAEVTLTDVRVPVDSIMGEEGMGLAVAQRFVHENRIRQAASGVGAAQLCITESVKYANERVTFGNAGGRKGRHPSRRGPGIEHRFHRGGARARGCPR